MLPLNYIHHKIISYYYYYYHLLASIFNRIINQPTCSTNKKSNPLLYTIFPLAGKNLTDNGRAARSFETPDPPRGPSYIIDHYDFPNRGTHTTCGGGGVRMNCRRRVLYILALNYSSPLLKQTCLNEANRPVSVCVCVYPYVYISFFLSVFRPIALQNEIAHARFYFRRRDGRDQTKSSIRAEAAHTRDGNLLRRVSDDDAVDGRGILRAL